MNSRIKEFVIQADKYANDICDTDANADWYDTRDEKFARLIVKECASHCDLLLDHKISSEWSRGTHDCSRAIKKHFGVTK